MTTRRDLLHVSLALSLPAVARALPADPPRAGAGGVLRVAATFADIPITTGQPNQGAEGLRFIGYQLYEPLVLWDLSRGDVTAGLTPGLALSWAVDAATRTVWTFQLRPGVRFHDGSAFDAEAVVWNLDKLLRREAPHYDQAQAAQGATYVATVAGYRETGPLTVEITTKQPDAVLPYLIAHVCLSSPARWREMGGDWNRVAFRPSGTGPWMLERLVARDRAEMVRNPNYWNPARIPKTERLVVMAVPDATTRVSALLSGGVDFIEAPPPDTLPRLRAAGMQVVTNVYPHIWCWQLSTVPGMPTADVRVRQAMNLAIDRESIVALLGGTALASKGMVDPGHRWFGRPEFAIRYDPTEAKRLLSAAGYGPQRRLALKAVISPSGSGQMQPLPMNEAIKQQFAEVGIDVEYDVMDWESLRARRRIGAHAAENRGVSAINNSWGYWEPDIGLIAASWSRLRPPSGYNWGGFTDAETDVLCEQAKTSFVPAEQDALLARLHARIVDQAMWLWVVHDLNPRALSPRAQGFVQAQSWFQDLTPIRMG